LNPKTFLMCNLYSPARRSFVIRFLGAGQPRPSNTRVSVGSWSCVPIKAFCLGTRG
jgi:hypothetical protein